MKRILYALAALIVTGCVKAELTQSVHFNATTGETKTVLNGKAVDWVSTDQISIIDHTGTNNRFTMRSCSGSSASFVGNVTAGAPEGYQYTAIYPYGSYSVSGSTVSGLSIPAEQTGKMNSFPEGLNFSCASGKADGTLTFHNLLTLLKFNVGEGANIHDIVITSNNGEPLSGTFSIDENGAVCNASGSSSISLNPSGSVFDPGDYYIAALPGVLQDGLEINLTSTSGFTTTKSTSAQVQLNPSKILTIYNAKPVRNGSISGSVPLQSIIDALGSVTATSDGKGRYWEAGFKVGNINWTINVHSSKGNKELSDGNLTFDGTAITIAIGHNGNCEIDRITFRCNSSESISRLVLTIDGLTNISATIGGQSCSVTQANGTTVWNIVPNNPASGEVVVDASVDGKAGGVVFTSLEVFN